MHRLCANTVPFYKRDLSILGFLVSSGGPGTNLSQILGDNCTFFLKKNFFLVVALEFAIYIYNKFKGTLK